MRIERLKREHYVKVEWVHFPLHPETPPEGMALAYDGLSVTLPGASS